MGSTASRRRRTASGTEASEASTNVRQAMPATVISACRSRLAARLDGRKNQGSGGCRDASAVREGGRASTGASLPSPAHPGARSQFTPSKTDAVPERRAAHSERSSERSAPAHPARQSKDEERAVLRGGASPSTALAMRGDLRYGVSRTAAEPGIEPARRERSSRPGAVTPGDDPPQGRRRRSQGASSIPSWRGRPRSRWSGARARPGAARPGNTGGFDRHWTTSSRGGQFRSSPQPAGTPRKPERGQGAREGGGLLPSAGGDDGSFQRARHGRRGAPRRDAPTATRVGRTARRAP